jgi:acyl-CoA dehydrogenase
MDFELSATAARLRERLLGFMDEHVYPNEGRFEREVAESEDPHHHPAVMEEMKQVAKDCGLWNLFLPADSEASPGLSNLDYAPLAEVTGRSPIAPEALNCSAPDTGNMEILSKFATPEQKERWLRPLLDGEIRSCFAMTEPDVASSDATNIATSIRRDGDEYVIDGRKWWISGAGDARCRLAIVMGKTDPSAPAHRQQSMVLVPLDTPGVSLVRNLTLFGYTDQPGHFEVRFEAVRVPASNLLGEEGAGFAIAQARLGPGRVHHCMRAVGAAERALQLMCTRTAARRAFGRLLSEQGVVGEWIADSRIEIDQARLYVLHTAWRIDREGSRAARGQISGIKVAVPSMALRVVDRAIQSFGAAGVGPDVPLARMYASLRTLRILDGPDEVHRRTVAGVELG